ncbi:secreted RxLR effector peptide protein, putative [Phytophthora infestans T30-4]|uniref:Secreted RxLR effector peptide protein, putative n=1 Tax=Phytophthora infestans (strain T30-4) TaxID=403677 RepID=D0MUD4_PHYIT|nr:secreted RxLR effector peptide protein, putative [Phytophthora infestans T30-4]EEY61581.1 secreted RxLR effector peptide protein, putative [Phytophthora infestans T30-4]|eukprot:XP_002908498.1 secreted RxLR effector peptide protein, putative [Phytophthora infestans T30-4]
MRFHCTILLAILAFLDSTCRAALSSPTMERLNVAGNNAALSRRFLRSTGSNIGGMAAEERSALSKIAGGVAKISPSGHDIANKMWLKLRTNPEVVFKELKLGKTGVKLDKITQLSCGG